LEKKYMKKKIIVLGSSGSIGHMVNFFLNKTSNFLIYNVAGSRKVDDKTEIINIENFHKLKIYIKKINPEIIINCIGILGNQSSNELKKAIYVNSLFPHLLKDLANDNNCKLIHVSTDCVYSGKKKDFYVENDIKDGLDEYSKTKSLGEIIDNNNLTIRSSIIGPELKKNGIGLFHWFMGQDKQISGYTNVYWSGVTTIELARSIIWAINNDITGLYNITNGSKISKSNLLQIINDKTKKNLVINSIKTSFSDKSFMDTRKELDYIIPSYEFMISELVEFVKTNSANYPHYNLNKND